MPPEKDIAKSSSLLSSLTAIWNKPNTKSARDEPTATDAADLTAQRFAEKRKLQFSSVDTSQTNIGTTMFNRSAALRGTAEKADSQVWALQKNTNDILRPHATEHGTTVIFKGSTQDVLRRSQLHAAFTDTRCVILPAPSDMSSYRLASHESGDPFLTSPCGQGDQVACYRSASSPTRIQKVIGQSNPQKSRDRTFSPSVFKTNTTIASIVTVERTVNAKIFLETFYERLRLNKRAYLSDEYHDRFDRLVDGSSYPDLLVSLSQHNTKPSGMGDLRRTRNIKTCGVRQSTSIAFGAAGFELICIIGKGSFGLVGLVRESSLSTAGTITSSTGLKNVPEAGDTSRDTTYSANQRRNSTSPSFCSGAGGAPDKGQVYAMKVIRKSDMLRHCQEGHLRAERDLLVAAENSRWIVPLIASFQDTTNLYLVMEYMVGGDFLGFLFRYDVLDEDHARWYVAEMVLGVEEVHKMGWIHRDIKPDNFLISSSGHLKIADFGLAFNGHWSHNQEFYKNHRLALLDRLDIHVVGDAQDMQTADSDSYLTKLGTIMRHKRLRHDGSGLEQSTKNEKILDWRVNNSRANAISIVGTSQYMAPEVIRGEIYDGRCDWWSIGIILYECLFGFTPFYSDDHDSIKARILDHCHQLAFPAKSKNAASLEVMDLLRGLLQVRECRISARCYERRSAYSKARNQGQPCKARDRTPSAELPSSFVHPDDAADIKYHPFFKRVIWSRHHLTRPPFVPSVRSQQDTRYFDDAFTPSIYEDRATKVFRAPRGADSDRRAFWPCSISSSLSAAVTPQQAYQGSSARLLTRKPKKRPRDKVLRDRNLRQTALEIRKEGAFIGYTYRRSMSLPLKQQT